MGLTPGNPIEGTPVDWVFIGSCANSRLSDLRTAARFARGRKVASGVQAWVVPGSETVKRAAVAEGLDKTFRDAGFQWREPSCSLCLSASGDVIAPGQRSVSTTNRNFIGRQGRGVRTHLASPPMAVVSAGVIGSIWPDTYATPPPMTASAFPIPTPTPNANPATYSQVGDNGPAASNPYNESTSIGDPVRPIMMNRPFRSVGEMGYAFRDQPFRTLSFSSANSPDAGLLDLFSVNDYSGDLTATPTPAPTPRGGVISLNSRQGPVIAGVLTSTIRREDTPRVFTGGAPSPSPSPLASPPAKSVATSLVLSTSSAPLVNRAALAALIASETGLGPTVPKTQRESIARALGEPDQTRTWNLMIDVIAQSGRYPFNASTLAGFLVEGEQRYWVHVAIDRFTGQVIDKQIEVVNE